jgi:hypothetical protein
MTMRGTKQNIEPKAANGEQLANRKKMIQCEKANEQNANHRCYHFLDPALYCQ